MKALFVGKYKETGLGYQGKEGMCRQRAAF
jgi:hypothetical protein